MPFDSRGHSVAAGSSLTPSSDLYQVDERAAVQSKKKQKMAVSSLPLYSLFGIYVKISQSLTREGWSEGEMCISCVIFALL